jgi:peptidoglycan/xylan/chitin deacetylase (PgdA/CDA1 family)
MEVAARQARRRALLCAAVFASAVFAVPTGAAAAADTACRGHVYLSFDTGSMSQAQLIADTLARHQVRATFFLANEKTVRGDSALDAAWADYWRARAVEGHAFGTHTWRHGRFLADAPEGAVRYRPQFGADAGRTLTLDAAQTCAELKRVDTALRELAGRGVDALWRAPGGYTTPHALAAAQSCGYAHVRWAPAGFLGDELPSEQQSNDALLARALRDIRDGDVLMAHLGIWSRKQVWAPTLDPLIAGLKARGLCFRTLTEHPQYRAQSPARELPAQLSRAALR